MKTKTVDPASIDWQSATDKLVSKFLGKPEHVPVERVLRHHIQYTQPAGIVSEEITNKILVDWTVYKVNAQKDGHGWGIIDRIELRAIRLPPVPVEMEVIPHLIMEHVLGPMAHSGLYAWRINLRTIHVRDCSNGQPLYELFRKELVKGYDH